MKVESLDNPNIKQHYLYRHIRLDKNQVFYIGIGTKNKKDVLYNTYGRAKSRRYRNKYWNNVVSKADYEIEIVFESTNYEYIKQKEIEFIKLYSRFDKGATLVNMTNGGDGLTSYKHTEQSKLIIGSKSKGNKNWLGKKHSDETKKLMSEKALKNSKETSKRMSKLHKGNTYRKGANLTDAQKLNISVSKRKSI